MLRKYRAVRDELKFQEKQGYEVQGSGEPDPEPGDLERVEFERFAFFEGQHAIFERAMETAATIAGSDRKSHLLTLICMDYLATNGGAKPGTQAFRQYLANLERLLHVRLVAYDPRQTSDSRLLYGYDSLSRIVEDINEAAKGMGEEE